MNLCSSLDFVHFADNSTVYAQGPNIQDLSTKVNGELLRIDRWLSANRLSLNVSKSYFTIFTNKTLADLPTISIQNKTITYVENI